MPLYDFFKRTWGIVEPGMPYLDNWHVGAIADHLEAVSRGEIKNLLINVPPGHAKSILVSALWPACVWTWWPEWRGLFSSYDLSLVTRDAIRMRDVITDEWYKGEFSPTWRLKADQNVKTLFKNTRQGFRFCHTVAGRGTGHRGDAIVVDDPLNAKERHSKVKREAAKDWWKRTMPTRLNDPRSGARVVIMQRLHEEDLSGVILEEGGFEHLCLMTFFEPERRSKTFTMPKGGGERSLFFEDPREIEGELLFPELFTQDVLTGLKKTLGEGDFAGQHQQMPAPATGSVFKTYYWRFWQPPGANLPPVRWKKEDGSLVEVFATELPRHLSKVVQSWDMTFKDKATSDFVSGQVWGADRADRYLLDRVHERLDFDGTARAVRTLSQKWPRARAKYIEDKANGPAIISHLRREVSGLIAVEPVGDKTERAMAVQPEIKSGNVFLPHPAIAPWVMEYIAEFTAFPTGSHDDDVDGATQALIQLAEGHDGGVYSS